MRTFLRFLRRFFVATFSGLFITSGILVAFWLLMGGWVATRLSSLANQHVFQDRLTRLHVGRVTGSVLSNIVFEDVRLERQIAGEWKSAVYADKVEARYDVWGLAHGHMELRSVRVWQPLIEIAEDSTGRWVLPVGKLPGERVGSGRQVLFSDIQIVNGKFRLNGQKRGWEAFDMNATGSLHIRGDRVDLDLDRASFEMLEPVGQVKELSGKLHLDGRQVRAEKLKLFWEGSSLTGDFAWDPADSLQGLSIDAALMKIPLGRLRGIFDAEALPDSGYVSGTARIQGAPRRFAFETALRGRYENRDVDTLVVAGDRDGSVFRFDRLRLDMPECRIDSGSGWIDLARGGSLAASVNLAHVQVDSIPVKAVKWIPGVGRGHLDLRLQRFLKGQGPLAAQVDVDFQGEEAFGIPLVAARGHVDHLVGREVRISGVSLTLPDGGLIEGSGVVRAGDVLDFDFSAETSDWSQLRPVVAIPGLKGSGRATGKLIGTGKEPALDISGRFTHAAGWEMAADSVSLVHFVGPFSPVPRFDGSVEAEGLRSLGRIIDHVEMDFHWQEPRLTYPRLEATDNDTIAVTHGWTDFAKSGNSQTSVLEGGTLTIGHLTWTPQSNVVIDGMGDTWIVRPARYRSAAGESMVEAVFDTRAGTMDSRFTGMNIDLAIMAGPEKPPEFKGGQLSGDLRLEGPILVPNPSGHLTFRDYRWQNAVVDSAWIDFDARGSRLEVRHGWATSGAGRLSFAGGADLPKEAWLVWSDWQDKKPIEWGRVILDNAEAWTDGVSIERWAAWNPGLKDLTGQARGRARFRGALAAPYFDLEATLTDVARGIYHADSVVVAGSYAPDRLDLKNLELVHEGSFTRVNGSVPLRLSIAPPQGEVLDQPMDLQVELPRGDLALVPLLAPMVESAAGTLKGQVRLRGTPKRYLAYGGLTLSGGKLQLKDREEVLENVNAEVRFDSTTVKLVSLTGSQPNGATVSGGGTFELGVAPDRAYKIELDLRRFILRQSGNYAARFDGHLEMVPLRLSDGTVRPMIVGEIHLDRAEIVQDFNQPQPVPEPNKIFYYSISVDAPRGIFIVNNDIDMEMAGRITARRTPSGSELIGEMDILRGYYTLLLRRFRITSGTLNFNRVDVIDPQIDITAETNDGEYVLTVHLSGQASNPVVQFAERHTNPNIPDLSSDDILRRLTPGGDLAYTDVSEPQNGGDQREHDRRVRDRRMRDVLGSVQLLLGEVQRDLARKVGVDEIRFDTPGPSDYDASNPNQSSYGKVGVSKWITPDVSVSYSQGLAGTQASDLSVEYRLGRLLFLRGEIIYRSRTHTVDDPSNTEYNLDLKFFHEY